MDIDLLATLVQLLRAQRTRVADDEEGEAADSIMAEEAERRKIDGKGAVRQAPKDGRHRLYSHEKRWSVPADAWHG